MTKIIKYILLFLGWMFIAISIIKYSLSQKIDQSILFCGIGTAVLFIQAIFETKRDETVNKTFDIINRKLSVIYLIVSIILFALYFA